MEIAAERILSLPCPLFVPLAEEGMTHNEITRLTVAEYLQPMRDAQVDTLILGCTHYPILKEAIGEFMGPDVALVDSAQALAQAAAECLDNTGLARKNGGTTGTLEFYLSDLPWKFQEIGERFLGQQVDNVHTVNLNELELDRKDDQ